uniref:WGS project CAEQ00000000 data, annotated contig 103 n=1 Tax=Trypanosoma congolense (strain IL3000) TaxID=1068625 RepID=F9W3C4_TRYCI|nr:unnamed protein product [Trypanosoma congolense IL3000]
MGLMSSSNICHFSDSAKKGSAEDNSNASGVTGWHGSACGGPPGYPGILPVQISVGDVNSLRCSWFSKHEAEIAREWQVSCREEGSGAVSRIPRTCPAVSFPENRTTGNLHREEEKHLWREGVPIGKNFFLALRAAWRGGGSSHQRPVPPPVAEEDLDESLIERAIAETVGQPLRPPVPLSFMVNNILVPQWVVDGLYDAPSVYRN